MLPKAQHANKHPACPLLQTFVQSFLRPGCTHITVYATVSVAEREAILKAGAAKLAQQLLQRGGWLDGCLGQHWAADMLVSKHV